MIRIRIVQRPLATSIDGIQLDRFEPGYLYEVGNALGALLLAEGWGQPVADERPAVVVMPPDTARTRGGAGPKIADPPNLIREVYPPYLDRQEFIGVAADLPLERRKRYRPFRFPRP